MNYMNLNNFVIQRFVLQDFLCFGSSKRIFTTKSLYLGNDSIIIV